MIGIQFAQYDGAGALLRVYPSQRSAAEACGVSSAAISQASKWHQRRVGGCYWRLVPPGMQAPGIIARPDCAVLQLAPTPKADQVLMTYRSISDAARAMRVSRQAIWKAVQAQRQCAGFRWAKAPAEREEA